MKLPLGVVLVVFASACLADDARFSTFVIDEETGEPISGANVKSWFQMDAGWRAWDGSLPLVTDQGVTDIKGSCRQKGKTNTGEITCHASKEGEYYRGVFFRKLETKDLFGVWQPDNLVATIRLQRVEHPIPLFVKHVELRDYDRGVGGFDGTNSVLRFDLMKGDWLPPYGNGEVADVSMGARVDRIGTQRRFLPQEGEWGALQFYDLVFKVELSDDDYLLSESVPPAVGIRVRSAGKEGTAVGVTRARGKRKIVDKHGDWRCEYFSDQDPDRCYTFRIRSRRNDKGELVEAYYGKIYGDFEFEGDDKKGLIGVKFLYYLNPKSLDRNLEWDMKTNLCPNPGSLSMPQP